MKMSHKTFSHLVRSPQNPTSMGSCGLAAKCSERGQLLIEAMVAVSVVTVGLLGVFSILSQSMGLNKVASDQYTASYLAAVGIEVVKNIIDTNVYQGSTSTPWNSGLTPDSITGYAVQYNSTSLNPSSPSLPTPDTPLVFDPASGTYSYATTSGQTTNFRRYVKISSITDPADASKVIGLRVNSLVKYSSRGGTEYDVNLEDTFYNWR